jgi:hypothetical protein
VITPNISEPAAVGSGEVGKPESDEFARSRLARHGHVAAHHARKLAR